MSPRDSFSILVCTGPTGGHFYPALSVADAFHGKYPQASVHFLMNKVHVFAREELAQRGFELHEVPWSGIAGVSLFRFVGFLRALFLAFRRTMSLVIRIQPRLVLGFGSYGSVLGIAAAVFRRIPVLIHEQNASAGRANQFLAAFANRIAISFPETSGIGSKSKVFISGYPLRAGFLALSQKKRELRPRKEVRILIFGGSQGAAALNRIVSEAMGYFSLSEKEHFAVTHIVGKESQSDVCRAYANAKIRAEVFDFTKQICDYFERADMVIARAGAGTIFELAATGKAAILIPYPHAGAHQRINAKYLVDRRMALMAEEPGLTPERLYHMVRDLLNEPSLLSEMGHRIRGLHREDAAEMMIQEGWKLICQKT